MRRCSLFIPANQPSLLQNADILESDSIIFDLEDAVIDSEKDSARILLAHYLNEFPYEQTFEIIVRVNSYSFLDILKADLNTLPLEKIDTIMFPKADIKSLQELDVLLSNFEKNFTSNKKIKVIPIIETASSLIDVGNIAKQKRVSALLLGAEDLASDMGFTRSDKGDEILFARSMVNLAAKANNIETIDTPYTNTNNLEGLKNDCLIAKGLGLDSKSAIHPNHVAIINSIFSPNKEEINYSKTILEVAETAKKEGRGAFSYQGKMIDKPILDKAESILKKAEKWGLL